MTDKEKLEAIRAEIEKQKKMFMEEAENFESIGNKDRSSHYKALAVNFHNLLYLIDSLQEEPVSSVWYDARKTISEDSAKQIICIKEDGLAIATIGKIIRGTVKWAYLDDLLNLSNVQKTVKDWKEMPASEELEQAAVEAFKQIVDSDKNNFLEIFKAGTKWQKAQEYTCYEEAFEDGAKWKKEKTIDKACKWIDENAAKYLVDRFVDSTRVVGIDTSITEDFRKDMED